MKTHEQADGLGIYVGDKPEPTPRTLKQETLGIAWRAGALAWLLGTLFFLVGCQSSRSVTVYVNGVQAANAQETSEFFYVPGTDTQRATVAASGAATASQGIDHVVLGDVATVGIVTGGAIAMAGGFTPPAVATGAAVAGAGALAHTLGADGKTTGTQGAQGTQGTGAGQ